MEFDSPEKDFPGLFGSGSDKSKKNKDDSDYSDGEKGKKEGRRKDKKEKSHYAALEGESSPEDLDTKSPSKSKKSKAFKFSSSKSKEKREKSREKDSKEEEKPDKDKESKKKDKERKVKDKKDKLKDKDKKDKKVKLSLSNAVSEEVQELGDVQPVFGVSVGLSTERSRCHDGVELPLVIRDCIDYLQEHALKSEQIYKVEPAKSRLSAYKRLYNNRERQPTDELDESTACGLIKLYLKELPEPILSTDLMARFEEVASHSETAQETELQQLLEQLPSCNCTLLGWLLLHFDAVVQNEKHNKLNAQSLSMLLSPPLQMSNRLLVTLLSHCTKLCSHVQLIKYVPPITSSSPKIPENPEEIQTELRKQESLLSQIHAEMNAGFVSKKREEQLWEVQRIITQLKRKLRSFEKKQDKSMQEDVTANNILTQTAGSDTTDSKIPMKLTTKSFGNSEEEVVRNLSAITTEATISLEGSTSPTDSITDNFKQTVTNTTAELSPIDSAQAEGLYLDECTGLLMVPKTHADFTQLLRLQLENQELLNWKTQLQARISSERAEILQLKQLHANALKQQQSNHGSTEDDSFAEAEYEKIIENYVRENTLLDQKKQMLAKAIFEERRECIALQVELALQQF